MAQPGLATEQTEHFLFFKFYFTQNVDVHRVQLEDVQVIWLKNQINNWATLARRQPIGVLGHMDKLIYILYIIVYKRKINPIGALTLPKMFKCSRSLLSLLHKDVFKVF